MEHIVTLLTVILVLVIFYLAQLPAKRQEKDLKKMQDELKKKDRIVTYNGLCGEIDEILEDRVIIKAEPDKIRLSIEKWAIAGIDERNLKEDKKEEDKKEKTSKKKEE